MRDRVTTNAGEYRRYLLLFDVAIQDCKKLISMILVYVVASFSTNREQTREQVRFKKFPVIFPVLREFSRCAGAAIVVYRPPHRFARGRRGLPLSRKIHSLESGERIPSHPLSWGMTMRLTSVP
jgi:hypothetical protein